MIIFLYLFLYGGVSITMTFSACSFPVFLLIPTLNSTRYPHSNHPLLHCDLWTKYDAPSFLDLMNPYPFLLSNLVTTPHYLFWLKYSSIKLLMASPSFDMLIYILGNIKFDNPSLWKCQFCFAY